MTFEEYLKQLNIQNYPQFSAYVSKFTFYKFGGGLEGENTVERFMFKVLFNYYKNTPICIDNLPTVDNDNWVALFAVISDTYHFNFNARFKFLQDFGEKSVAELGLDGSSKSTYDMDYKSEYKGANTPTQYYDSTADFDNTYTNEKNSIKKSDNRVNVTEKHKGTLSELEEINKIRDSLTTDIITAFSKLFIPFTYVKDEECLV